MLEDEFVLKTPVHEINVQDITDTDWPSSLAG